MMCSITTVNADYFQFSSDELSFRLLTSIDEALFCQLFSDAAVMRFISEPFPDRKAQTSFHLATRINNDELFTRLYLVVEHNNTEIGIAAINKIERATGIVEIGRMLLPQYQRSGLGRRLSMALTNRLAAVHGMKTIEKYIDPRNVAAITSAVNVGYKPTENNQQLYYYVVNTA